MEHILVIEDDPALRHLLLHALTRENYEVTLAGDGPAGVAAVRDNPPDLVILDWMMPGLDGPAVCRQLRAASSAPILMLTAKDGASGRVFGLESGADDYLMKPLVFPRLLWHMRALLCTAMGSKPEILKYSDLQLDTGTRLARRGERRFELTHPEYNALEYLMRNPHQVLTREQILDRIWGPGSRSLDSQLTVRIRCLRQKTEFCGEPRLIHTVRNGYVLREK